MDLNLNLIQTVSSWTHWTISDAILVCFNSAVAFASFHVSPIHRRSQGLHPQGGEKNLSRPNLQEKCESAPPARARVNF